MAKEKSIYICSECGAETSNWAGKCSFCGAWNTLREMKITSGRGKARSSVVDELDSRPKKSMSYRITKKSDLPLVSRNWTVF